MKTESLFIQSIKAFLDFHIERSGNQKRFAEQCGVSPANISRWASDNPEKKRIPRMEDFAPVLDHFGIILSPEGLSCSTCPNCTKLIEKNKWLEAKNEALLEAIAAQASAQNKDPEPQPFLQAL